jgi:hypothetical protein
MYQWKRKASGSIGIANFMHETRPEQDAASDPFAGSGMTAGGAWLRGRSDSVYDAIHSHSFVPGVWWRIEAYPDS